MLSPGLAALVVKTGVSLALLGDKDRSTLLALAASRFEVGRDYREAEVNSALIDWLADTGSMLRIDHVELRRWLVDARFIARDGYGRSYVRGDEHAQRATTMLGSDDAGALALAVDAVRAAARQAREAKRRAFEER